MKTKDPMESQRSHRDEAIEGIRRGLGEAEAGKGRPAREAIVAIRNKHRIPGSGRVKNGQRAVVAERAARIGCRN